MPLSKCLHGILIAHMHTCTVLYMYMILVYKLKYFGFNP